MIRPETAKILQEIKDWAEDFENGPMIWFSPWKLSYFAYIWQDGSTRRIIVSPEYRQIVTEAVESGRIRARLPEKVEDVHFTLAFEKQDLQGADGPESRAGGGGPAPHRQPLLSRWAARLRRSGPAARRVPALLRALLARRR